MLGILRGAVEDAFFGLTTTVAMPGEDFEMRVFETGKPSLEAAVKRCFSVFCKDPIPLGAMSALERDHGSHIKEMVETAVKVCRQQAASNGSVSLSIGTLVEHLTHAEVTQRQTARSIAAAAKWLAVSVVEYKKYEKLFAGMGNPDEEFTFADMQLQCLKEVAQWRIPQARKMLEMLWRFAHKNAAGVRFLVDQCEEALSQQGEQRPSTRYPPLKDVVDAVREQCTKKLSDTLQQAQTLLSHVEQCGNPALAPLKSYKLLQYDVDRGVIAHSLQAHYRSMLQIDAREYGIAKLQKHRVSTGSVGDEIQAAGEEVQHVFGTVGQYPVSFGSRSQAGGKGELTSQLVMSAASVECQMLGLCKFQLLTGLSWGAISSLIGKPSHLRSLFTVPGGGGNMRWMDELLKESFVTNSYNFGAKPLLHRGKEKFLKRLHRFRTRHFPPNGSASFAEFLGLQYSGEMEELTERQQCIQEFYSENYPDDVAKFRDEEYGIKSSFDLVGETDVGDNALKGTREMYLKL